jgi:DNA-binding beta-propeller fold protein YncE
MTSIAVRSSLVALTLAACTGTGAEIPDPCDDALPGTACIWAGTGVRGYNVQNPTAHRLESQLYYPSDLTFGPDGRAYIVDWNNHRIRRVEADNSLVDVMGTDYEGDGAPGNEDRLPLCNPAGALGTDIALNHPTEARFGPDGMLYVSAWHNNKIRVLDPKTGMAFSLVGNGYGFTGDGGPACNALMNQPKSVTFDDTGTLYAIDQRNVRIRAITSDHVIDTIAGVGQVGDVGDGGPALEATFGFETGTTPRTSGALAYANHKLYIADSVNNRIRQIDLETGIISCIAGLSGALGYYGDGGRALDARFNFPQDLEIGPDGRLYIADRYNHAIRAIDLTTGIIDNVARDIGLDEPYGIAFDAKGDLYIADTNNHRIVKYVR